MSAARIILFPVHAQRHHEISGSRAGLMNRPKEREPSPGSAWPWITFTGAAGVRMDLELGDFEEPSGRDKEVEERLKATLEAPCDYARWLRLDAWTLQQAACIISGIDPDRALGTMNCFLSKHARVDTPGRFEVFRACAMFAESLKPMLQEMKGSHFAGKLKILGPWLDDLTMVDPPEAIRWAASKGYDIPSELEHQVGGTQPTRQPHKPEAHDLGETAEALVARGKSLKWHDGRIMLEVKARWGTPPKKTMERAEIAAVVNGESPPCKKTDASTWYRLENLYKNTVAAYRKQQTEMS